MDFDGGFSATYDNYAISALVRRGDPDGPVFEGQAIMGRDTEAAWNQR